ncbi:DinB family protein [Neobacillus ginsengisoli]|uniref:Damage-inducible protein DinB n=1 Tax=Neobacillus ginsengisoli TaxID=904295 RepID=A0ABT9XWW4_9BACI|nr:DinB family protein [Neobacillus ginsengisoli]MDQ0199991.1 putative damage-inducible protein DinB [Neobacillus ginsengisoli]
MFQTLDDFFKLWNFEVDATQKILNQLTDESLSQEVTPQNWTLGRIAWHTVAAIGVVASRTDLAFDSPNQDYPVPTSAKFISDSYQQSSNALSQAVKNQWADKSLREEQDIFGQKMSKGDILLFLIQHQIHHRGQMTILMRQAGLTVPGLYGPSKEEWAMIGMEAPKM